MYPHSRFRTDLDRQLFLEIHQLRNNQRRLCRSVYRPCKHPGRRLHSGSTLHRTPVCTQRRYTCRTRQPRIPDSPKGSTGLPARCARFTRRTGLGHSNLAHTYRRTGCQSGRSASQTVASRARLSPLRTSVRRRIRPRTTVRPG